MYDFYRAQLACSPEVNSGGGALLSPGRPGPVALRLMLNSGGIAAPAAGIAQAAAAAPPRQPPPLEDVQSCIVRPTAAASSAAAAAAAAHSDAPLQVLRGLLGNPSLMEVVQLMAQLQQQGQAGQPAGLAAAAPHTTLLLSELEQERRENEALRQQLELLQRQASSQALPRSSDGTQVPPSPPGVMPLPAHLGGGSQPRSSGGGNSGPSEEARRAVAAFRAQQAAQHAQQAAGFAPPQQGQRLEAAAAQLQAAQAGRGGLEGPPLDRGAGTPPPRKRKRRGGGSEEGVPPAPATKDPPPQRPAPGAACKQQQQQQQQQRRRPTSEPTSAEPRQRRAAASGSSGTDSGDASTGEPAAAADAAAAAGHPAQPPAHALDLSGSTVPSAAGEAAAEPECSESAELPPDPRPEPDWPEAGAGRLLSLEAWRQHKQTVVQWRLRRERREAAEAERAGKRRRRRPDAGRGQPPPQLQLPQRPSPAVLRVRQQRQALAAAQGGRAAPRRAAALACRSRVAAAVRSGGTAAAGQQEEGEEEAPPADMPALRHSAPLLRQGRSALHGWGMFAGAPIRRGAFVVEYCGEVVSNGVADRREREYEASGDGTMYLFRLSRTAVIDATRKGNAARYINHCCDPNCFTKVVLDVESDRRCMCIFAMRDIDEGEELTYHYMIEEEPDQPPIPCRCGADNCTGRMN